MSFLTGNPNARFADAPIRALSTVERNDRSGFRPRAMKLQVSHVLSDPHEPAPVSRL
jgi:hypothetical protein